MSSHPIVDFNDLVRRLRADQTVQSHARLFAAVCRLPRWYLVGLVSGEEMLPWVSMERDEPLALAFTDEERAEAAVAAWRSGSDGPDARIVATPAGDAVQYLEALGDRGLSGVRFNHGPWGFESTVPGLAVSFRESVPDSDPDFDVLAEATQWEDDEDEARRRLWDAVHGLQRWYLVGDYGDADDPMIWMVGDESCLLAFTDRHRARAYLHHHRIPGKCGRENLVTLEPGQAPSCLARLRTSGVGGALFNDGPHSFYASLDELLEDRPAA